MFDKLKYKIYKKLDTPERKKMSRMMFIDALKNAHQRGYDAAEALGKEAIIAREEELKDEYGILLATKDIELSQAHKTIQDYRQQIKDAQKAYRGYYHDTIGNKKLVAEISGQIRRLFNTSGDIYKAFITIQDAAEDHFKLMVKQDPLNRNLLGLTQSDTLAFKSIETKTLTQEEIKLVESDIDELAEALQVKKDFSDEEEQ